MPRALLSVLFAALASVAYAAAAAAQTPYVVVRDRFDLTGGPDAPVRMRVETTLRGHEAERFRQALGQLGLDGVSAQYEAFYRRAFEGASLIAPLSVAEIGGEVVVTEAVSLPAPYEVDPDRGVYAFDFFAYAIRDIARAADGSGALAVANPFHSRHETVVLLPAQDGQWAIPPETLNVSNAGFDFAFEARPGPEGLYLMAFELRATASSVPAQDAAEVVADQNAMLELAAWGFEIDAPSGD